ncbi:MAG: FAD-dependent oxidoreductase [Clostridia bacterium]|nr:FAD-dependent oxidoreductase [Clostridia bacterium]
MKKRVLVAIALIVCMLCTAALADTYTAGTYTAEAKGFGEGMVTVTMTFDGEKILDVKAEGASETPGIGSVAIESLPAAILAAQSADVDLIAGCTFSGKAVKMAAADCIAQAKGETSAVGEVKMAPGTYVGRGLGFRISEPVTVSVTVDENSIKEIVVDTVNMSEKPALMQTVIDLQIPRMIEQQSVAVDAVCGATASGNAVRQAVEAALTEALVAGGSDANAIAAFCKQAPKSNETKELSAQVVVVGMGGAGTSAALSAAENGLSVIAIDKAGKWGGTSTLVSGPMSINAPSQVASAYEDINKAAGEKMIDEEALFTAWCEYTTDETGRQQAKVEFIRLMMDESGVTTDWLTQYGFQFDHATTFAGNKWPAFSPLSGAKKLTEGFYAEAWNNFSKMGGNYLLETEGYDLILDESGKVCGVKARSMVDGTEYVIKADAVILATGGFAGSAEMEEKYLENTYFPIKGAWKLFGMHQNDGKMIQAAIDNGAGLYNVSVAPMVHVGGVDGFLPGFETVPAEGLGYATGRPAVWSQGDMPLNMAITSNTLAVGKDAKRFTSESDLSMFNPWKSGPHFYSIWGQDQVNGLKENGFSEVPFGPSTGYLGYGTSIPAGVPMTNADAVIDAAIKAGFMFKADSVAELAEKMGLDAATLTATVEAYNGYCAAGEDKEFGKDASKLVPITGDCFYGIVGSSWCYSTCGGLDIDTDFRVLKADHVTPMEGLYAVGTDSMGVLFSEHIAYVTYGGAANGFALTSGRLAGASVAKALAK